VSPFHSGEPFGIVRYSMEPISLSLVAARAAENELVVTNTEHIYVSLSNMRGCIVHIV
jgi:hypothetical protein